jgi:hypothetical protein
MLELNKEDSRTKLSLSDIEGSGPDLTPDETPQDPTDDGSQADTSTRTKISLADLGDAPVDTGVRAFGRDSSVEVSEFSKYMDGVDEGVGDIFERRAQNQGNFEQFRNMVGQAVVGEIVGGTIEGLGYLLDIPAYTTQLKGTEQDWGNWLSNAGKGIREGTQNKLPIHVTRRTGEGFAPGNWDWWMSNGVSLASTLSLAIPAFGAARGAGMVAGKIGRAFGASANAIRSGS